MRRLFGTKRKHPSRRAAPAPRVRAELLERRVLMAAGDLDPTFSGDGKASFSIPAVGDIKVAAAVLDPTDQGTIVVGDAASGDSGTRDLIVLKFKPDGQRDTAFGPNGDGTLVIDATGAPGVSGANDFATSVALDPRNNNILIAGYASLTDAESGNAHEDVIVTRITHAGAVDTTFNGSGTAQLGLLKPDNTPAAERANALAVNADGSVLVAGQTDFKGKVDFILARFRDTGVPDTGFAGVAGGVVITGFQAGADESANALYVQPDGKIVAAGDSRTTNAVGGVDQRIAVARYNLDGTLDTSFGDTLSGVGRTGKMVWTYRSHGSSGDIDHASSVAADADGRIIVGGFAGDVGSALTVSSSALAVARLTADGQMDTAGGQPATAVTPVGGFAAISSLVVQASGKVIASAQSAPTRESFEAGDYNVGVVRYGTGLSLDTTFAGDGTLFFGPGLSGQVNTQSSNPVALARGLRADPYASPVPLASAADDLQNLIQQQVAIVKGLKGEIAIIAPNGTQIAVARISGSGKPTAVLELTPQPTQDRTAVNVSVLYVSDETIDLATVDGGDVTITAPDGGKRALAVAVAPQVIPSGSTASLTTVRAVYRLAAPAGTFGAADAGTYKIDLAANQVKGLDGQSADAVALGQFGITATDPGNPGNPTTTGPLTAAVQGVLPAAVVGGAKSKVSLPVLTTNTAQTPYAGAVMVTLYVSADATFDSGDTSVGQVAKTLKLKAGAGKAVKVKIPLFPSGLPDADYFVIADVTDAQQNHSRAVTATKVRIAPPFSDLRVAFDALPPALTAGGKAVTATVAVTAAAGNVTAAGPVTIHLSASPDAAAGGDTALADVTANLKLKVGATKRLKLKILVPAGFTAGSYYLVAERVAGTGLPTDPTPDDGVVVSSVPVAIA